MRIRHVLLSAMLAIASAIALADDDHDRARRALQAGEILPLHAVLERVAREHPGQVLEVELEREDGAWVYELKLLRSDGALLKLELDARSGALLRSRQKDSRRKDD
ncbi:MAG: PepSY domain-containing protein [Burkholderiaceae bacterium]|nr:PepSY domain-containing protein [Burkholderiaceae bacterium]